jgi:hypothetical protein
MKRLLIFLALLSFLMLSPSLASACECICKKYGDGTPIAMEQHSAAVFVGEVVSVTEFKEKDLVGVMVNFRVERYWKGVKKQEIVVRMSWACCDRPHPKIGDNYLVYAVSKKRETTCTRTRALNLADEDLPVLGAGKTLDQTNGALGSASYE